MLFRLQIMRVQYLPVIALMIISVLFTGKTVIGQRDTLPAHQNKQIDSLRGQLHSKQSDSTKINIRNKISRIQIKQGWYKETLTSARETKKRAKKINYHKGVAKAANLMGRAFHETGQYDKALVNFKEALQVSQKTGKLKYVAFSYNNMGMLYKAKGQYDKALTYYKKALKIKKKLGEQKELASTYQNIGVVYDHRGDYDKALQNYQQALKIEKQVGNKRGMVNAFNNIGLIHKSQKRYGKAMSYYKKALAICEKEAILPAKLVVLNNMGFIYEQKGQWRKALEVYKKNLAVAEKINNVASSVVARANMGSVYLAVFDQDSSKRKENEIEFNRNVLLDSAFYYFDKALQASKRIGYQQVINLSLAGLGKIWYRRGAYQRAVAYYKKAAEMADSTGALPRLYKAYEGLARSYEALGRYQQAYDYHVKYAQLRDSVHSRRSSERIAELEEKYEAEKRERKIKMLEKDKKIQRAQLQRNRVMLYSAGGGLLLVLVFSGLLYNRFRVTREQKEVIEHQKEVVEQKNEAIGASIDYARRIQSAILRAESEMESVGRSNYFILFRPKEAVSGDFYWAYRGERDLIWTASDCTGHGVPGAFMSMIGNRLLNEVVIERGVRETGRILDELREGIISTLQQSGEEEEMRDGMDMALCRWYNVDEGGEEQWIEFSGAKNPLYVVGEDIVNREIGVRADRTMGDELIELKGDKQPIGYEGEDHQPFESRWLKLRRGDVLYTFSDGYADQFGGPRGKKFMYKRFKRTLIEIQDKSMPEQGEYLEDKIEDWMAENDEEQLDDICVMGMRIT